MIKSLNYNLENTASIFEDEDIVYNKDVLKNIIIDSINHKDRLYMIFKNFPTWNEENGRFYIDVDGYIEPNFGEARRQLRNIASCFDWTTCSQLRDASYHLSDTIGGEDFTKYINDITGLNISKNKKTSKIISALVEWLFANNEINDHYRRIINQYMASLGDSLKEKEVSQRIYFSIAFYDYITMSNGHSWSSCHWMDGCHCAGTISYAMDDVTFIVYAEDKNSGRKLWRRCFMLSDEALLTSRLYGSYEDSIVEKTTEEFLKLINKAWTIMPYKYDAYFKHFDDGCQYPDYHYSYSEIEIYSDDNKDVKSIKKPFIGYYAYCVESGEVNYSSDSMNCRGRYVVCEECGRRIEMDEAFDLDGTYYCRDCVEYCEECMEWYAKDGMFYDERRNCWVCDSCFEEYYVACTYCEEWVHVDDVTNVRSRDGWKPYCPDCID